ncbi:MAG: hypothetical protein COT74_04880 [Bdellovibrionales bacterium CG10_big_fil_rev_8_21_14_0_10_45_34]|nr:MAG: hypothetical protein COT74_04880 [Bdellovibrionales bacterium CG10_big_fil_rev_8_21_14_0_10_45_34]
MSARNRSRQILGIQVTLLVISFAVGAWYVSKKKSTNFDLSQKIESGKLASLSTESQKGLSELKFHSKPGSEYSVRVYEPYPNNDIDDEGMVEITLLAEAIVLGEGRQVSYVWHLPEEVINVSGELSGTRHLQNENSGSETLRVRVPHGLTKPIVFGLNEKNGTGFSQGYIKDWSTSSEEEVSLQKVLSPALPLEPDQKIFY